MSNSGSSFVIGLLVGTAIGATVGFLLAPQSGAETRQMLRRRIVAINESPEDIVERARKAVVEKKKRSQASGARG